MSADIYTGREQTRAKHFILKRYLEGLAFKVLTFTDITYVDGFSGPWQTETADHSDSSFMIAIKVLQDAQERLFKRDGTRRRVRCFFSELSANAYAQMRSAVAPFHKPECGFEIETYHGTFEDAVDSINKYVANSFPLIFIDPTGWAGYPFEKIRPLFSRAKCEVLITFMYPFIYRFAHSDDEATLSSLSTIFGGSDWRTRMDPSLPRGIALEKLFRDTLKEAGSFRFVVSIRIDRTTSDYPHYYITYGTKSLKGLREIRETEYAALREHARTRAKAQTTRREAQSGMAELFSMHDQDVRVANIDEVVAHHKALASQDLVEHLRYSGAQTFESVLARLLEKFMLRETDVKDVCVALAKRGVVQNSWGRGNKKPKGRDAIALT